MVEAGERTPAKAGERSPAALEHDCNGLLVLLTLGIPVRATRAASSKVTDSQRSMPINLNRDYGHRLAGRVGASANLTERALEPASVAAALSQ